MTKFVTIRYMKEIILYIDTSSNLEIEVSLEIEGKKDSIRQKIKRLFPLALVGGFLDSIGGGGWGPIVSSTLIARGKNPKYIIGSVNLAEFFITLASSLTFVAIIGLTHWAIIVGLIIGGITAAPIAAYLTNKIPTKTIMILVAIVVIVTSLKRLFF